MSASPSRTHPRQRSSRRLRDCRHPDRHEGPQLKGSLAHGTYHGQTCEQWQIEVSGGGDVWYFLDTAREICWITLAGMGHPRATDST
ncbi:hypothetical protein [Streptomyces sp. NBC_01092]|uniref:hypothetical protein n=1 Tax=Streptomyces sp. NBC_01092 TaxID=2903748 RepID=UPI00386503B1|nr:hypothetical protein OG254_31215 [Streptomyces sp. NBC_01092]